MREHETRLPLKVLNNNPPAGEIPSRRRLKPEKLGTPRIVEEGDEVLQREIYWVYL